MPLDTEEPVAVVHRDRDVVVACKPAGVDVHGRGPDDPRCFVAAVARALGLPARRLHPASRLDKPVSGLVPLALSKVGRKALTEQYQRRLVHRTYLALAARPPEPRRGLWDGPIGPDPRDRRSQAVGAPGARAARTAYVVVEDLQSGLALVELTPETGRTHQLRVHLAAAGCPIVGDRRYGGPTLVTLAGGAVVEARRVMLHAACLSWLDPTTGRRLEVSAGPTDDMAALLSRLR